MGGTNQIDLIDTHFFFSLFFFFFFSTIETALMNLISSQNYSLENENFGQSSSTEITATIYGKISSLLISSFKNYAEKAKRKIKNTLHGTGSHILAEWATTHVDYLKGLVIRSHKIKNSNKLDIFDFYTYNDCPHGVEQLNLMISVNARYINLNWIRNKDCSTPKKKLCQFCYKAKKFNRRNSLIYKQMVIDFNALSIVSNRLAFQNDTIEISEQLIRILVHFSHMNQIKYITGCNYVHFGILKFGDDDLKKINFLSMLKKRIILFKNQFIFECNHGMSSNRSTQIASRSHINKISEIPFYIDNFTKITNTSSYISHFYVDVIGDKIEAVNRATSWKDHLLRSYEDNLVFLISDRYILFQKINDLYRSSNLGKADDLDLEMGVIENEITKMRRKIRSKCQCDIDFDYFDRKLMTQLDQYLNDLLSHTDMNRYYELVDEFRNNHGDGLTSKIRDYIISVLSHHSRKRWASGGIATGRPMTKRRMMDDSTVLSTPVTIDLSALSGSHVQPPDKIKQFATFMADILCYFIFIQLVTLDINKGC